MNVEETDEDLNSVKQQVTNDYSAAVTSPLLLFYIWSMETKTGEWRMNILRRTLAEGYSVFQQLLLLLVPALLLHQALLPGDLVQEAAFIVIQSSHHVPCHHGNKHALNTWQHSAFFHTSNHNSVFRIDTRVTFTWKENLENQLNICRTCDIRCSCLITFSDEREIF